jgi:hypothetical protein
MKPALPIMSRRRLLRGAGVLMALPMLEAMIPSSAAAQTMRPKRFQVFYTPNGMTMRDFVPAETGTAYQLTPVLKPLEPFRDRFTVITGLASRNATALGDGSGDHGRACGTHLTGVHVKKTEGYDLRAGVSMDQVVAQQLGKDTQLASLELGIDQTSLLGSCDEGYSCTYTNTVSWRSPTTPMPISNNPRDVFERIFGDGESLDKASRLAQLRRRTSLIDFVMEDTARLQGSIGANDKQKLEEYLDSAREIEQRIQLAEKNAGSQDLPKFDRPSGAPDNFQDHVRLMVDLQVLAMQSDITRVSSLMLGRELTARSYPEIGVPDAHHAMSHHGGDPEKLAKLSKINAYHMQQLAYQMQRLSETKEGDGTLLDNTLIFGGPSFGDSNSHDHLSVPIVVAGGLTKGGRHIMVEKDTPFSNLMVTAMGKLGLNQPQFGDSTGPLADFA